MEESYQTRESHVGTSNNNGVSIWHTSIILVLACIDTVFSIYPTLAALTNLNTSLAPDYNTVQGRDLSCQWMDTCTNTAATRALVFEWRLESLDDCLGRSARFAVRYGNYKLHYQPTSGRRASLRYSRAELYDVIADPMETTDLLLTRSGDKKVKDTMDKIVTELRSYTESSDYDVSLFPQKVRFNANPMLSNFVIGGQCKASDKSRRGKKSLDISDATVRLITGS